MSGPGKRAILPVWLLLAALLVGAILGLVIGLSDPGVTIEERIIHEYEGRKS
jgi:hypothetical protein